MDALERLAARDRELTQRYNKGVNGKMNAFNFTITALPEAELTHLHTSTRAPKGSYEAFARQFATLGIRAANVSEQPMFEGIAPQSVTQSLKNAISKIGNLSLKAGVREPDTDAGETFEAYAWIENLAVEVER